MAIRLSGSTTLKLALLYLLLFTGSVLVLSGFLYWATAGYMERQTRATIETEIQGLSERYEQTGLAGLSFTINQRLKRNPTSASIYLLTDPSGNRILGNLDRWPKINPDAQGWVELWLSSDKVLDDKAHPARAQLFTLRGGFRLLVGRDMEYLRSIELLILEALGWGILLTTLLGLAGGLWMGRRFLRRVEQLDHTAQEIMAGDMNRRMPLRGSDDELDSLARTLNRMLDRINELMIGVKQVSDNIAHDMRTPLSRLRQTLESAQDNRLSQPEQQLRVEQAVQEADHLLSTFNALLRIGNIEARHQRQAFEQLSLNQLLDDVVELYEPIAEDRQQLIEFEQVSVPAIQGDRNMLFQVLANLLDNALKYSPEQGLIQVTMTQPVADRIEISIRDSGPGIPAELQDKVFQRFYRMEKSRTTPGNGLGLSLVRAVCDLHNIKIQLQNTAPGMEIKLLIAA
ncbi:MAG: HAMP domain-containing histidine kinase [Marinobacterium sp.]|nr:HAMP domain-containing histidine kinase [Marinobacterium sp.]